MFVVAGVEEEVRSADICREVSQSIGGGRGKYRMLEGDVPACMTYHVSPSWAGSALSPKPPASEPTLAENSAAETEGRLATTYSLSRIVIWHLNIQGLRSSLAELTGRIRLSERRPDMICINESFLDSSIGAVELEGYKEVARRDRVDGSSRGGIIVHGSGSVASQITFVLKSEDAERVWCIIHTDCGPYLLGAWYSPPGAETGSILECVAEHSR